MKIVDIWNVHVILSVERGKYHRRQTMNQARLFSWSHELFSRPDTLITHTLGHYILTCSSNHQLQLILPLSIRRNSLFKPEACF